MQNDFRRFQIETRNDIQIIKVNEYLTYLRQDEPDEKKKDLQPVQPSRCTYKKQPLPKSCRAKQRLPPQRLRSMDVSIVTEPPSTKQFPPLPDRDNKRFNKSELKFKRKIRQFSTFEPSSVKKGNTSLAEGVVNGLADLHFKIQIDQFVQENILH